jgi:Arc/MetJ-type ribon-helix-helix transcriptional regulator
MDSSASLRHINNSLAQEDAKSMKPERRNFGNDIIVTIMKTIAISIEDETLDRMDRLTATKDRRFRNRSKMIQEAMREYLTRVERLEEETREREILQKHRVRLAREADALVREQAKS